MKFCRVSERLRFKQMPQASSRTRAFAQAGVYNMIVGDCKDGQAWVQDMSYDEIPAEYLRRLLWTEYH